MGSIIYNSAMRNYIIIYGYVGIVMVKMFDKMWIFLGYVIFSGQLTLSFLINLFTDLKINANKW